MFFILSSGFCFGQEYLLENEEVIFSFETSNGKKMVLAKDKENEYIIYRFGTDKKIALEYPEKNKQSWDKFRYFYYHKPGGPENGALYLSSVSFKNEGYEYTIIDNTYLTEGDDEHRIGILITNEEKGITKTILGVYETVEGSLDGFAENGLLKFEDTGKYE